MRRKSDEDIKKYFLSIVEEDSVGWIDQEQVYYCIEAIKMYGTHHKNMIEKILILL
jgi:hypothetical protein